jgi:hypothetical protein
MSFFDVILMEDHMSIAVKAPADAPVSVSAPREQPDLWAIVLILGVIAACAIGAGLYLDAPLLDASMVGP